MIRQCFVTILLSLIALTATSQAEIYKQIRIDYPDQATFLEIAKLGIEPVAGKANEYLEFAVNETDLSRLAGLNIPYTVIHEDLTAYYQSRNPLGTTMGGFRTFGEMVAVMDSFSAAYPSICTAKWSIATTEQGRSLWVMKISDNPGDNEAEPEAFINAMHHAREPIGMEICLEFTRFLLTQYNIDPLATNLVNNYQIYVLPCSNPDGYEYNRQTNPSGGGMWRKNRRNNWDGNYGVDLNRNYNYFWGYDDNGSSPSTGDLTYRGPSAASEPEISGLMSFQNAHDFTTLVSFHSYGNYFLKPYGYYDGQAEDVSYYDTLAAYIQTIGFTYGTPWQLLYNTNGDAADYGYGEQRLHKKCFATVVEVGSDGDGFWPQQNRIVPLTTSGINFLKDFVPRSLDAKKRRLPQMPTVISPSEAMPGAPFYLKWTHSTADTFNAPVSYRVTELSDESRAYETFESTTGYEMDGFTRSSTVRHGGSYSAYSGQGTNARKFLTLSNRLKVSAGDILNFWTRYNIQTDYDYAYVEISTDGGGTWYQINGNLSTQSNPHRHNKGFGITGSSNSNWVLGAYPLTNYVGQEIQIRFEYWTDASGNNEGFYVDDIYPTQFYGSSVVRAESNVAESLLVGPYPFSTKYYTVQARDDRGHMSAPSNRFQVNIQGTPFAFSGHVALSDSPGDLSGSVITIPAASLSATTNSSGDYDFGAIPGATYDIIATHLGYSPDTVFAFVLESDSTLDFVLSPAPPGAASLVLPANGSMSDTGIVDFDWNDVPFADTYIAELATDFDFAHIVEFDSSLAVSSFQNSQPLPNGRYYWRITSRNEAGYSPRSAVWNFTVNFMLQRPILTQPEEGRLLDTSFVAFDWNDVPLAAIYIIEVATDTSFAQIVISDSTLTSSDYSATVADGEYYWRVTAFSGIYYSPRSEWIIFTVVTNMPTPTPSLPADDATLDSSRVFFDWNDVPFAYRYILEVSTDSSFSTYAVLDSNVYMTSEFLSEPLANGLYYWRLTATNDQIYSARTAIMNFTVDYWGIPAPVLITPIQGMISTSAFVNFDWSDVDDTITYILEVSLTPEFDNIVVNEIIPVSHYSSLDSLENHEYFWRVRATDGIHTTPNSIAESFYVEVDGSFLPGDANGNDIVNGIDVVYLVHYLKGGPAPIPMLSGDANGSCSVNGLDVTYMVIYFKGWGQPPFAGDCATRINSGRSSAE
jgi:murein tripeptide amidase MpaA